MRRYSPRFVIGDLVSKIDWDGRVIERGMIVKIITEDEEGQILSLLTSTGLRQEYSHDMTLLSNSLDAKRS